MSLSNRTAHRDGVYQSISCGERTWENASDLVRRTVDMPSTESGHSRDVLLHQSILKEFGYELNSASVVLDFGCGEGNLVNEYREFGFQAFGTDIALEGEDPLLRRISMDEPYRIPFDDNTFDFVYSNFVLEHVEDLDSALSEIYRVLKPGGASLHLCPPRGKPIEPHVFVPLGTILQNRPWLLFWALLGVRNRYQKGLGFAETARRNYVFLHERTFYRSRRELRTQIDRRFNDVTFADKEMITHGYGRARLLLPLVTVVPSLARIYGQFHQRCLFFKKPRG